MKFSGFCVIKACDSRTFYLCFFHQWDNIKITFVFLSHLYALRCFLSETLISKHLQGKILFVVLLFPNMQWVATCLCVLLLLRMEH